MMTANKQTVEALDMKSLHLPADPHVVELDAEEYTDSSGEPALRVQVILDESVDVDNIRGEQVGELKFAIRDSLRRHGVTLFPYIFLAKKSELAEAANED